MCTSLDHLDAILAVNQNDNETLGAHGMHQLLEILWQMLEDSTARLHYAYLRRKLLHWLYRPPSP